MPILTDDMKRVVREQSLGFAATVCPDGTPNLSPKGTTSVLDDDHLVFADLFSPGTIRNLRTNSSIELNVIDPITRLGYRFKGSGEVHADGPVFEEAMALFDRERQLARSRVQHVVVISVEFAAPLVSPAYDVGLTGEEVADRSWRRLEQIYGVRIDRRGTSEPEVSFTPQ
jgi:predicted pyridoxine 5'-phosphate oxidase superfamily flavin-nucleotide-binding protein